MKNDASPKVAALRRNYSRAALTETEVAGSPFEQFGQWFAEAQQSGLPEPNAMTLATASHDGRPSARTVLLKGFDQRGFVFFTNFESRKATDLAENPHAALLFTWLELERQVRLEGRVIKVDPEAARTYFQSRPRGSQLGAWASPQSRVVESREALERNLAEVMQTYPGVEPLPLPPFWGGFCLQPEMFEFWQGRENRLHDRVRFLLHGKSWSIDRLAP